MDFSSPEGIANHDAYEELRCIFVVIQPITLEEMAQKWVCDTSFECVLSLSPGPQLASGAQWSPKGPTGS